MNSIVKLHFGPFYFLCLVHDAFILMLIFSRQTPSCMCNHFSEQNQLMYKYTKRKIKLKNIILAPPF